ncbi:MAG: carboxypeptidase regulatory-like domain-containing protein [Planctomycetes bacterium]|nr:carboxypeptidase regulatory-like domain-containing protein [Planctomycetota bacterium]
MKRRRPSDPRAALRADLLAGERGAEERVRAHLERAAASGAEPADESERELADELRWVGALERELRAAAPDPDLARRICTALPIGRPRLTPLWRRALASPLARGAAIAASALLLGGLAWVLVQRSLGEGAAEPEIARLDTRENARWFGLVEYRDARSFDPRRRTVLSGEQKLIETGAHERALSTLDPWFADAARTAPELYRNVAFDSAQTSLEVDTDSKVATQVYDARGGAADWMSGAYELARAYFGAQPVEGPILEIQVVRGSARVQHNGVELELHDADMVLLARQGPPLRVEAPMSALGEPPSESLADIEGPEPREASEGELGRVEGFVRDAEGRLLERFDLTLWRVVENGEREARLVRESLFFFTAPDGRFEVEKLSPGRYRLGVASPEHVTRVSDEFQVPRGGAPEALEIALEPGASVRGRVIAARDGQPLAGARVRLAHPGRPWWWTASDTYGELRTERDGGFECQNRESGYESLWVEAEGFASRWIPPVPLTANGTSAPLEIHLEEESVLHGFVSDALGEPLAGVKLRIHGFACCFRGEARTNARGYYRLGGLGRGSYQIAVLDEREAPRMARLAELGAAHVRREDFGGENARVLVGVLRDERGRSLAKHALRFYEIGTDGALRFAPSAQATCGDDGAFRVELAPSSRYRVRVASPDEAWSADLSELALDASRDVPAVDWTLRGTTVDGTLCLLDAQSGLLDTKSGAFGTLRGARLVLRSQDDASREWRTALRDGAFTFRAVPPGRYLLRSRFRGWLLPEREVLVGAAGATLTLNATPAARVEVQARDEKGQAILSLAVWQRSAKGERRLRTRATPLGVLLEDLPAESVELVLRAEGYAERALTLDLAQDPAPRVELELAPR